MIWKGILITVFAVGVMANIAPEQYRQQMKEIITDICKKNGAEDKVEEVETKISGFVQCVKDLFDVEAIKKEVEEAKPNGALDEVFKKHCAKSPQLKTCIHTLTSGLSVCMDADSQDKINMANNGTDQIIDFVCHKDGDRIALFIAESGPQCFQEKVNEIRECVMKVKDGIKTADDWKAMSLNDKCKKFDDFSTCVVQALEGCSTPTPANMAESMLRFVRKSSSCPKKDE